MAVYYPKFPELTGREDSETREQVMSEYLIARLSCSVSQEARTRLEEGIDVMGSEEFEKYVNTRGRWRIRK
jgi:hypothetical protein